MSESFPIHIVIVSFGYPPIRHVSGMRAAHMARELSKLGHDVSVITVDWRSEPGHAESVVEPRLKVLRIDPRQWYPEFRADGPPFTSEPPSANRWRRRLKTLSRTLRWGPYEHWARAAFRALLDLHRSRPVDVVWAIHGDDSCHEIAFRFNRASGVPWVADFKDPWDLFHPKVAKPLQWLATSRRLRTAAALTETSRAQAQSDRRFNRPTHVIWSGYDADLMTQALPRRSSDAFCIVHAGHIGRQHDANAVVNFLELLKHEQPDSAIELHVFGHGSSGIERILESKVARSFVRLQPFVEQREVFGILKGADVLLLLPATHWVPSGGSVGVKELEYFASGTPILTLGRVVDEMRALASAQLVEAESAATATRFIEEELDAFRTGRASVRRMAVNSPSVLRHGWHAEVEGLAAVLVDAANTHQR